MKSFKQFVIESESKDLGSSVGTLAATKSPDIASVGSRALSSAGRFASSPTTQRAVGLLGKFGRYAGPLGLVAGFVADAKTQSDMATKREFDDIKKTREAGKDPYTAKETTSRAMRTTFQGNPGMKF